MGQGFGAGHGPGLDAGHDLLAQLQGLRGVVGDPQPDEQIRQAHDPQADLAVGVGDGGDLGQGVVALVDDVVQEGDPQVRQAVQFLPVQVAALDQAGQVDGAQVAGFIGQQGLLAARVGGFESAHLRGGVVPLDGVQEDEARVAGLQGVAADEVEDLPGPEPSHLLSGCGG